MDNLFEPLSLENIKTFVNREIRPYAQLFDEKELISREVITKIAQMGFLGATIPTEYGGLQLNDIHYGFLTEEVGKACSSVRSLLTVHVSLVAESILKFGTAEQKQKYLHPMTKGEKIGAFALTEPMIGTDAGSIQTAYSIKDNKYYISGRKKWITLGGIANFVIVIAVKDKIVTAFLVDLKQKGVAIKPIKGLLSNRGSYISEIILNNVMADSILGAEGIGFTHIVNRALDSGRYSVAWGGVGIAQEALDAMVSYSRSREQFNARIYTFHQIQEMLGQAFAKIQASRALCIEAGNQRINNEDDAVMKTIAAKYFSSKIANEVAYNAIQVHGANGFSKDYSVERLFREARTLEVIEGTSQILEQVMAKYSLRKFYNQRSV